jgi:flavin reductase (DIM6/NTAB) family NADH-FMN oxidoreductase RutF
VLNLASDDMGCAINALARTTGTEEVPASKIGRGYKFEKDKFGIANLTPQPSDLVQPLRIQECRVQMEAELVGKYDILGGAIKLVEVKILRTHVLDQLRLKGHENRIDPDAWHPMIMSFQHLYGLRNGKMVESKLAKIDEDLYRPSNLLAAPRIPEAGPMVE